MSDLVKSKLNYWVNQLRDMGRRNRLLFFRDTQTSTVVISSPGIYELFETIVDEGKHLYAPLPIDTKQLSLFEEASEEEIDVAALEVEYEQADDEFLSNKSFDRLNRTLRNLRYNSRTIREERGFNALYLSVGFIRWREKPGTEFEEAPLILVPIDIERESSGDRMGISFLEDEIVVNPTLFVKLNSEFDVDIPGISSDLSADDLHVFFENVQEAVTNLEGWQVIEKTAIGIFNFQTMMIINDLQSFIDHYLSHPIINLLAGNNNLVDNHSGDLIDAENLDEKASPLMTFQVLDADSSQQEAIEASKRGVSFVLQGPPGTGKSQTITNIIAEGLADGKKILFVSQKQVALEVVYKRIAQRGLADFCLEVHDYKKSKLEVIRDLGNSLAAYDRINHKDTCSERTELAQIRSELNQYVRELHKPRKGMEISLFHALGSLAQVLDAPSIRFAVPDLEHYSKHNFEHHKTLIKEFGKFQSVVEGYDQHPWKGFKQDRISLTDREEVEESLSRISSNIQSVVKSLQTLTDKHDLPAILSWNQAAAFVSILKNYRVTIFERSNLVFVERLNGYKGIIKFVTPSYYRDKSALKEFQREGVSVDDLRVFSKEITNIILEADKQNLSPRGEDNLSSPEIDDWQKSIDQIRLDIDFILNQFEVDHVPEALIDFGEKNMVLIGQWAEEQSGYLGQIQEWIDFKATYNKLSEAGIGEFATALIKGQFQDEQWIPAFTRRVFMLLVDEIMQESPVLKQFNSRTHEELISRFKELDEQIIEASSLEIAAKLQQLRPSGTWVQAPTAETTILKKEMNKKRRIKPLRRLFREIPNLILLLRPCLMMSPLTVSQLLDPELYHFDLAIFDEASQVPPEYAVGAIMRADQVVVVGDRHQLPPTRFFQSLESDDEDDDNDIDEYESILVEFDAIGLPSKMLRWHYRSEDESLIAFSNYEFYQNKLLTFPNSEPGDPNTGLSFVYVEDGIYRRSKGSRDNPKEAEQVARLVKDHFDNFGDSQSLGVVTFSQSQRSMVQAKIDQMRQENPYLSTFFDYGKDEEFFVKNLENVQGDERDVIIFSVGYGKDELGKLLLNFGPLNKAGGGRRLNVAVTRARKAVKFVSSMLPEDIDLSRTNSEGTRLLRSYMKFAHGGMSSMYEDMSVDGLAEFDSPFEEAVYDSLTRRGLSLDKQIGVSGYRIDFGVKDPDVPGKYILGIECDGAAYHSSATARDRDRLRQQILEDKFGWRIHRIWSRDWINDKQVEIKKVLQSVEESKKIRKAPVKKN